MHKLPLRSQSFAIDFNPKDRHPSIYVSLIRNTKPVVIVDILFYQNIILISFALIEDLFVIYFSI